MIVFQGEQFSKKCGTDSGQIDDTSLLKFKTEILLEISEEKTEDSEIFFVAGRFQGHRI